MGLEWKAEKTNLGEKEIELWRKKRETEGNDLEISNAARRPRLSCERRHEGSRGCILSTTDKLKMEHEECLDF